MLVISSPNRPVYNEGGGVENHFHVRELDRAELAALLAPAFPRQAWYAQRVRRAVGVVGGRRGGGRSRVPDARRRRAGAAAAPAPPMYFVVVCAANGVALPALPALSLFDDGALSLWRDYARALARERELAWDELDARKVAEDRLAELVAAINALASAREAGRCRPSGSRRSKRRSPRRRPTRRRVARLERRSPSARRRWRASLRSARMRSRAKRAAHGETRARLAYRESARGWLRFPFAAARQRMAERR